MYLLSSEIFTPTKVSVKTKADLIERVFEAILQSGENGVFQTELCKAFSLDSRDGSRLVGNLEKRSLVSREKILYKGRWTYKLNVKKSLAVTEFTRKPIEVASIEGAPCFSCTFQHLCSSEDESSPYSPAKCIWIEDWVLTSVEKITQDSEKIDS